MSPGWRMCSIFMPKRPIPRRPVVCFDEGPTQLIGEVREPIRRHLVSLSVTIANIGAMARPICSCFSTHTHPGGM